MYSDKGKAVDSNLRKHTKNELGLRKKVIYEVYSSGGENFSLARGGIYVNTGIV